MSTYVTPKTADSAAYDSLDDDRGYGWVAFAGVLLLMLGTMNVIEGIAAIGNARFFVHNTSYIIADLKTWGWIVLFIGVLQLAVGLGVFVKNQFARWTGIAVLGVNAIVQLLMMPAYPFWSLSFFAIDILAIYALVVTGSESQAETALSPVADRQPCHRHGCPNCK